MRFAVTVTVLLVAASAAGAQGPRGKIVDLTHPFDERTIYWPTAKTFELEKEHDGETVGGWYYAANYYKASEHGGTHIDAPVHFYRDRNTVDEIPLTQLVGSGVLIDVSRKCAENRDYLVSVADLQAWERRHGRIPRGAIVLLNTGFGKYWPDWEKYMGTSDRGKDAVKDLHFPGLDPEAARWLIAQRAIKAVGLDTPSIDYGQSTTFTTHVVLCEKNVPAFENVARLDKLPARGFTIVALPMLIAGGSGGPLRIVAFVP